MPESGDASNEAINILFSPMIALLGFMSCRLITLLKERSWFLNSSSVDSNTKVTLPLTSD